MQAIILSDNRLGLLRGIRIILPFIGLCILFTSGWMALSNGTYFNYLILLSSLQLLPLFFCIRVGSVDSLTMVLLNYFLGFTLHRFKSITLGSVTAYETAIRVNAARELALCIMLMILSYYMFRIFDLRRAPPGSVPRSISLSKGQFYFLLSYVVGFDLFRPFIPSSLISIANLALPLFEIILLTTRFPPCSYAGIWCRIILVISAFASFVFTGSLERVVSLGAAFFIISLLLKQYRSLVLFFLLALFAIPLQAVKSQYRAVVWRASIDNVSRMELLAEMVNSLKEQEELEISDSRDLSDWDDSAAKSDNPLSVALDRLGDDSLERVLGMTPEEVPFWNGETYSSMLTMFIPRFLWPDKPIRTFWNKYGRLYHVLLESDYVTSVAVNYFAEGYMNFGYIGLYGVALLMGFIFAGVEALSRYVAGGNFAYAYIFLIMGIMNYACDLGTVISVIMIDTCLLVMTAHFLRQAQGDEYS